MVSLKYLRNSSKALEMPPYYSEINFTLTRSVNCVVSFNNTAKQATTFVINNTKTLTFWL